MVIKVYPVKKSDVFPVCARLKTKDNSSYIWNCPSYSGLSFQFWHDVSLNLM
jgi:hypothetical protein